MMQEDKPVLFGDVLDALFNRELVPIHLLFRLSDMRLTESSRFFAEWPAVSDERRQEIMRHLVDLSEENFVVDFTPVFKAGLSDPAAEVRIAALDGLWDSTDTRLISTILRIMQTDEDARAQAAAASALAHFVLMAEWGQVPRRPVEPAIEALLAAYEAEETAVAVKRSALEALGAADHPRIAEFIQDAYESEEAGMQLSALFAMGNSADPRWLPVIFDELHNPDPAMRAEAAQAAGGTGSSDAVPRLAELVNDEELDVREAAVVALGQIGGDQAQEILSEMLADSEYDALHGLIREALDTLLLLGGEMSLMDYLEDEDEDDEDFYDDLHEDDDDDDEDEYDEELFADDADDDGGEYLF
jgi:HEAT repeat protein